MKRERVAMGAERRLPQDFEQVVRNAGSPQNLQALDGHLMNALGSNVYSGLVASTRADIITVVLRRGSTASPQQIEDAVKSYRDPPSPPVLSHATTQCIHTPATSAVAEPAVLQSFIMSPLETLDGDGATALDSIKLVLEVAAANPLPLGCQVYVELYNLTEEVLVMSKSAALPAGLGASPMWMTVQMFGLRTAIPGADCIWQIRARVGHADASVRVTCMQSLFYDVDSVTGTAD